MEKTFTLAEIKNILMFNAQEVLITFEEPEATSIAASIIQIWLQFAGLEPSVEVAEDMTKGKVDVELLPEYCRQRYADSLSLNFNGERA